MSHRPLNQKRAERIRKVLRTEIPVYMDLVQWLMDHRHAKTKREAREVLLAGRVTVGSHIVGVTRDGRYAPHIPAKYRSELLVAGARDG
jgi:hypothetical protein